MINTQHIHTTKIEGGFLWVRYNPEGQWFQVEPEELLGENKLLKKHIQELEYRVSGLKADLEAREDELGRKHKEIYELENHIDILNNKIRELKSQ